MGATDSCHPGHQLSFTLESGSQNDTFDIAPTIIMANLKTRQAHLKLQEHVMIVNNIIDRPNP